MPDAGHARVLLVVALVPALLLAASVPASAAHEVTFAQTTAIDADTVQLTIDLQDDGDARWEIRYRVRLETENDTAAFESLAADVSENNTAYADQFRTRIGSTVAAAENATGRSMAVRDVSVRTERQEIPQQFGVLVYAFEWTGFAVTDGDVLRAGDAIAGLYLDEVTSLTVQWPDGLAPTRVDPPADQEADRSVTWRGPAEFTGEQPRLVVSPAAPTETTAPPDGGDGTPDGQDRGELLLVGLVALVGLAVLFAGAWWWRRRGDGGPMLADDSDESAAPPEELLSNEERVLQLIEANGGRMKQQQVVEQLGWTDAKTSQVVSELRESGELEGFRLGRENVLRLPDEEPAEAGEE